ncbi:MAG: nucleotidyltransferase family protein [Syntrophomonadaceae bacterium]|nr:nucleotidyltransferase family protein [Syntrophomonadaceae bacterium]
MAMACDAIILAGGELNGELRNIAAQGNEGLILVGSAPMIHYVYTALRAAAGINRIVISGPVELLSAILPRDDEQLYFTPGGDNMADSFASAVNFLRRQGAANHLLALPVDIPLISPEAIEDFIRRCEDIEGDFFYSLVLREVCREKYPEQIRTYFKLKDGVFTGGNLLLINNSVVDRTLIMGQKLVARRKNPLALVSLFGPVVSLKLLLGRLSIAAAERRALKVLKIRGRAVVTPYAEIGIDVDKLSDLETVKKYLCADPIEE